MSLRRSALTRLALATAVGALVTAAVVTPAAADDEWNTNSGTDDPGSSQWDEEDQSGGTNWQDQSGQGNNEGNNDQGGNNQGGNNQGGNENNQWSQGGQGGQSGQGGQGGGEGGQWSQNNQAGQGGQGGQGGQSGQGGQGGQGGQSGQSGQGGHNGSSQRLYRGRVTASRLLLRSRPTRASQVIRTVHRGEIVSIFCKTSGQNVQGNPLWYLLTDGTWAWGAARYIDNIGEAPRWC
ncbi:SH3 domain-containing protein [Streptomyces sp. NPDC002588]|uniref:SH3 domain-containing protein n=1 Tax=Streptomyces sp. NPDC002588 TaxID=3154419 RepID=UPI0033334023